MVNIIALFKNCVEVTENIFLGNVYYNCYFCLKSQPDNMITTIASSRVSQLCFINIIDKIHYCFSCRYFRMSPNRFQHLLGLVSPLISKKDTNMRKAITPEERLALTLRFLATGDSQQSLSFSFRIGKATLSRIIAETCDAIYEVLKDAYLSVPKTKDDWLKISQDFEEKWNMPHAVGCIDCKHIRIECPKLTGTQYYNYKGFFSILLMAICDANYCFTVIDIGQYGSNNDSGILASSVMGEMFDRDEMNLPSPSKFTHFPIKSYRIFYLGMKFSLLNIGL